MSAYRNAIAIEVGSSDQRLELAARALAERSGVVLLEGFLGLRPTDRELLCEVIDPAPAGRRCVNEYEVLVENARRTLEASAFYDRLPRVPRKWLVVEDDGTGTAEVWRAP